MAFCSAAALADPPGRVGRIGAFGGSVWLMPAGSDDWVQAGRNQPVVGGDRLATDTGGMVEVDIGTTTLRLGGDTQVLLQQLDDSRIVAQVDGGSMTTRLRTREAALAFTAVTPEGRFVPLQPGYYRIDRLDPSSHATSYEGSLRFDGPDSTLIVSTGQHAEFWRNGDAPGGTQYTLLAPTRDGFGDWSAERDREEARLQQPVYVSPEMPGAEDLSRYGQWATSPEYGALWTPSDVSADWAPYSDGYWSWVAPWGWTWIDDAPWGFAPFHYGRWVHYRDRWAWAPGSYVPRPVYAPALVGWVGGGPPVGGPGGRMGPGPQVGWFPLAPREVFVPGYAASPGYIRGINAAYARQIPNLDAIARQPGRAPVGQPFVNRHVPGAISAVATTAFVDAHPRGPVRVDPRRELGRTFSTGGMMANEPARTVPPIAAPPSRGVPQGGPQGPRFAPPVSVGTTGAGGGLPQGGGRPVPGVTVGTTGRPEGIGQAQPGAPLGTTGTPQGVGRPVPGAPIGTIGTPQGVGRPVPGALMGTIGTPQGVGRPVPGAPMGSTGTPQGIGRPVPGAPVGTIGRPEGIQPRGQPGLQGQHPPEPEPRRYQTQPVPQWQRQEEPRMQRPQPQVPQQPQQPEQPRQQPFPQQPRMPERPQIQPQPFEPRPARPMPAQPQMQPAPQMQQPRPAMPVQAQPQQQPGQVRHGPGEGRGRGER